MQLSKCVVVFWCFETIKKKNKKNKTPALVLFVKL